MSILIVIVIVSFTVAGNLLLKIGVVRPGLFDTWPASLVNGYTLLGTLSFGLAFVGYATLLQRLPLNLAQAIFSIQFVAVIVSSAVILGEPISWTRWIGIGLILCGLVIVGSTASRES